MPRNGHLCPVAVLSIQLFFQGFGRSMAVLDGNNSGARAPSWQDKNGKDLTPTLLIPELQSHIHRDIPAWDRGMRSHIPAGPEWKGSDSSLVRPRASVPYPEGYPCLECGDEDPQRMMRIGTRQTPHFKGFAVPHHSQSCSSTRWNAAFNG